MTSVIKGIFRVVESVLKVIWKLLIPIVVPLRSVLTVLFAPILNSIEWVTRWAKDEPNWRWGVVTTGSLIISALLLVPFLKPEGIAIFLFGTMIHEAFHGGRFHKYGVPVLIVQIGMLAAACIVTVKRLAGMTEWQKADMYLAGPVGSMGVALVSMAFGSILASFGREYAALLMYMSANFNVLLVIFNLIAMGGLDGGKFFSAVYASVREVHEWTIFVPAFIFSAVILYKVFVNTWSFELLVFAPFIIFGFVIASLKDNPKIAYRPTKMQRTHMVVMITIYMALLVVASVIYPTLPSWTPLMRIHPLVSVVGPGLIFFYAMWASFEGAIRLIKTIPYENTSMQTAMRLVTFFLGVLLVMVPSALIFYDFLTRSMPLLAQVVFLTVLCVSGISFFLLTKKSVTRWHRQLIDSRLDSLTKWEQAPVMG